MTFPRGTTQTIQVRVPGVDLTGATAYMSFRQGGSVVVEKYPSISYSSPDSVASATLSQDDTLLFKEGLVEYQVRYLVGTTAGATEIFPCYVTKILKDGKISHIS